MSLAAHLGLDLPPHILLIMVAILLLYLYVAWPYRIFIGMKVPGPKPQLAHGNLNLFEELGYMEAERQLFITFGNIFGIYEGRNAVLMIRDVNILKEILIKRFNSFTDRRLSGLTPWPLNKSLQNLSDNDWWRVHMHLKASFTPAKVNRMFHHVEACSKTMVDDILVAAKQKQSVHIKNVAAEFTVEVLARAAFDMQPDGQGEGQKEVDQKMSRTRGQDLLPHLKATFTPAVWMPLVWLAYYLPILTPVVSLVQNPQVAPDSTKYFTDLIHQVAGDYKPDAKKECSSFLQMMVKSQTKKVKATFDNTNLTDEDILGQCFSFFCSGFDTVANSLSFFCYCMATNQKCQDKLHRELASIKDLTCDAVSDLSYLDWCVKECLRIYPPTIRAERVAMEGVDIDGLVIPENLTVGIPIYALHHSEEHWKQPEKYRPERFSPGECSDRDTLCYLPFGAGPRHCLGVHFALLQLKTAAAILVKHVKFDRAVETQVPLQFTKTGSRSLRPDVPIYLKAHARRT